MSEYVGTLKGTILLNLYDIHLGQIPDTSALSLGKDIVEEGHFLIQTSKRIHKAADKYLQNIFNQLEEEGLIERSNILNLTKPKVPDHLKKGLMQKEIPRVYLERKLTEKGIATASILKKAADNIKSYVFAA